LEKAENRGYFFSDRTLWSHPGAGLCTEPDGLFVSYETMKSGRIKLVEGTTEGYVELEGTPDMVLEIVSPTTVRKDTVVLRDLYWRAGVPEYWLVDVRRPPLRFDILRHAAEGYIAVEPQDGWLQSAVFGKAFQLTQQTDPMGHPQYTLAVRP
jgi:Uma2 family endonuclease